LENRLKPRHAANPRPRGTAKATVCYKGIKAVEPPWAAKNFGKPGADACLCGVIDCGLSTAFAAHRSHRWFSARTQRRATLHPEGHGPHQ